MRRRQEVRGIAAGVTVIDDFAHHPTAIRETLRAQGPLRPRQAHRGVRAALGDEPPQRLPGRVRRRAVRGRRGRARAALRAREGARGERLDVERLAADLRREDVPARLVPTVDATVKHIAERASPGDTVLVMRSGDYGGLHDKLLRGWAIPSCRRAADKAGIRNLLNRVGILHPVLDQFWPNYLVIPGDGPDAPTWSAASPSRTLATSRCCACWPSRPNGAARAWASCSSKAANKARAPGRQAALPRDRRRPGLLRREARLRRHRPQGRRPGIAPTAEYMLARSKTAAWMRKVL